MDIINKLSGLSKKKALITSFILVASIAYLDYSNGKEISFRILYLIPITLTTWNVGLLWGIILSLLSAVLKMYYDYIIGTAYANMIYVIWEGLMIFGIFSLYVVILSKLKNALRNLEEKNRQLKEANQLKDEFLGIASHDLKNPLNNILNLGSIIEEEPELPGNEIEQIGRHIREISQQMFKIIDNLITSASIDMMALKVKNDTIDVVLSASNILKQYGVNARKKSINFHLESSAPQIFIYADENLFIRIFDNLVSNAIKFSEPNKNVWVRIYDDLCNSEKIKIEIQDEGPGFSEKDKSVLFTRFSRLSAKPTGKESSTGLGLYIVKKYIDLLEGSISCVSQTGKGAKFVVEIPVKLPRDQHKYQSV